MHDELDRQDALRRLTTAIRQGEVTADDVLAALAYLTHGETQPLIQAREDGAEIGSVGSAAHMLRRRLAASLHPQDDAR